MTNLPLTEGEVHLMRLVLENETINVLNEANSFDTLLAHECVWATINTKHERLMIYYIEKNAEAARLVKVHECRIEEDMKEFEVRF